MQTAQLHAVVNGDGFQFEAEIAEAAMRREEVKQVILAHERKHGC
jgi:hypothetical protein